MNKYKDLLQYWAERQKTVLRDMCEDEEVKNDILANDETFEEWLICEMELLCGLILEESWAWKEIE